MVHRTTPALGGVAVAGKRPDAAGHLRGVSVLAAAIGLEGPCEVEFRRDENGRPLLMEINARLAGPLEISVRAGLDFPLMVWQWAAGLPVDRAGDYRTPVRMRWLWGDLCWFARASCERTGPTSCPEPRPIALRDRVPPLSALRLLRLEGPGPSAPSFGTRPTPCVSRRASGGRHIQRLL